MGMTVARSLAARGILLERQDASSTATTKEESSTTSTSPTETAAATTSSSSNTALTNSQAASTSSSTSSSAPTSAAASPATSTTTAGEVTSTKQQAQATTSTAQAAASTTTGTGTSATSSSASNNSSNAISSSSISTADSSVTSASSQPATSSNPSNSGPSSSSDSSISVSTSSISQMSTYSTYSAPPISTTSLSIVYKTISTFSTSSSTSTGSIQPLYSGSGPLLTGYCATPEYTLVEGAATVYYAPFVGCVSDKPDCCPYAPATSTISSSASATGTLLAAAAATSSISDQFPQPMDAAQATLAHCPVDYFNVNGGCCPSGFLPYSAALGGETPCFSSLASLLTPPPLTEAVTALNGKPTAAVINLIYAKQYAVKSAASTGGSAASGPSAGSIAGIVFGVLLAVGVVVALTWYLIRGHRQKRSQMEDLKDALHPSVGTGMSVVPTAAVAARGITSAEGMGIGRSGSRGALMDPITELSDAQKVRDNSLGKSGGSGFGIAITEAEGGEPPGFYRGFMQPQPPPPPPPPPKGYAEKTYLTMRPGHYGAEEERTLMGSPQSGTVSPPRPPRSPEPVRPQHFHRPMSPPAQPPPPYAGNGASVQGTAAPTRMNCRTRPRTPTRSRSGRSSAMIQRDLPLHLVGKRQSMIIEQAGHTRHGSADSGSYYGEDEEIGHDESLGELMASHAPGKRYQLSDNF